MRHQRTVLWILLLHTLFLVSPSFAKVSVNVPMGHWSYKAIDKLIGFGLINSAMRGTRPWTRLEMARLILEARSSAEAMPSLKEKGGLSGRLEIIQGILRRLEGEFKASLDELEGISETKAYFKPLEDVYGHYLYGREDFDIENDKGQKYAQGSNLRTGFSSHGVFFDHLAFYVNPEFRHSKEGLEGEVHDFELLEGYVKLGLSNIELEVGRDSQWWGTGRHGSLILTPNVHPLDMIKVSNPMPVVLPWVFKHLGLFKFSAFWAELEADRVIPDAELMGLRVHFKPFPFLDIGAARTIMLGGQNSGVKGAADLSLSDWTDVLSGENLPGALDTNQIAGLDFELLFADLDRWVSVVKSMSLWGEWYGEDEASGLPSRKGYVWGLKFGDVFLRGKTDVILEYADNVIRGIPDYWYHHSVYKTGYTYERDIIGHNMGSDARDYFVGVDHFLTSDLILDLGYNHLKRGVQSEFTEETNKIDLGCTYQPSDEVLFQLGYRFEKVNNLDREAGNDQRNHIVSVLFTYSF